MANHQPSYNCINQKKTVLLNDAPFSAGHSTQRKLFTAWNGREPITAGGDYYHEIVDYLNSCEGSARVAVGADRKRNLFEPKSFKGHAFVMEKRGDSIVLVDPQIGRVYNDPKNIQDYFIQFNNIQYMRIDDLEVSDRGISACKAVAK